MLEFSQVIKRKQCEANSVCAANVIFIISFPIICFFIFLFLPLDFKYLGISTNNVFYSDKHY